MIKFARICASLALFAILTAHGNVPPSQALPAPLKTLFVAPVFKGDTNSAFELYNQASATAGINIRFYDSETGEEVPAAEITDSIVPLGRKAYFMAQNAGLPSPFVGSAVVTSDQDLKGTLCIYRGRKSACVEVPQEGSYAVCLPQIVRQSDGLNSWFAVQNVGSTPATVRVRFKRGTAGNDYEVPPVTLRPGAARLFYQETEAQLGPTFAGSALVASEGGLPIVATAFVEGETTLTAYPGIPGSCPALFMPIILRAR